MAKQLNVILITDCSHSMDGEPIKAVNRAIKSIGRKIAELNNGGRAMKIRGSVLGFADRAFWIDDLRQWPGLKADGNTYLCHAYELLDSKLRPVGYGGVLDGNSRPVLIILSDGLPTSREWISKLQKLRDNAWFKKALRYAVGYNISSPEAVKVLEEFTNDRKNIIRVSGTKAFYSIIRRVTETTIQERKRFECSHSRMQGRVFKIVARDIRFIGRSKTNIERRQKH